MYKIIDEINISGKEDFFTLNNTKNDAQVTISLEKGRITLNDSCGNTMQNYPSVTRINFEIFNLTEIGQTINRENGNIIAYLSSSDVQELAEKTFYEYGQTRVYDFINLKFNVVL